MKKYNGVMRSVWPLIAVVLILALFYRSQNPLPSNNAYPSTGVEPPNSPLDTPILAIKNSSLQNQDEKAHTLTEQEVLNSRLQVVAEVYAESIKYPIGSQPIINPQDVREYEPYEQSEVSLPFPLGNDDENPITISAATNSFQYFTGETIFAQVKVVGAPDGTVIDVEGGLSSGHGDLPQKIQFSNSEASGSEFVAIFDTQALSPKVLTPEMLLKLRVVVGNRELYTTVAFRYSSASANITGVDRAAPQGANLNLPIQLDVIQEGYFYIKGVLADVGTDAPLIELQGEGRLPAGKAVITLHAHISALMKQGSAGPYVLRHIRAYRGADVGESADVPVSSTQSQYPVVGFPFSAYENESHVDELAQERLEFLRNLGSVNKQNEEQ